MTILLARPLAARPSGTRPSAARPSAARTSTARTPAARTRTAKALPARPSFTRPSFGWFARLVGVRRALARPPFAARPLVALRWLALAALALAAACGDIPVSPKDSVGRGEVTTTSGVKYTDTFLGSGPAAVVGDEVMFEYTLWLEDGQRIDSTADRGYPVKVILGQAPLKGWNDGLLGIQLQGERRIVIPPALGYGAQGLPGMIPPNATLVFDVHVLRISHPQK